MRVADRICTDTENLVRIAGMQASAAELAGALSRQARCFTTLRKQVQSPRCFMESTDRDFQCRNNRLQPQSLHRQAGTTMPEAWMKLNCGSQAPPTGGLRATVPGRPRQHAKREAERSGGITPHLHMTPSSIPNSRRSGARPSLESAEY